MTSFFVMAWRNVWRNLRRSVITILAVGVGLGALIFAQGFSEGMHEQMINSFIRGMTGHLQVHAKGYLEDRDVELAVAEPEALVHTAAGLPHVVAVAPRVIGQGLLSSADNSAGVMMLGIAPDAESRITNFRENLVDGAWLAETAKEGRGKEIIIGVKLRKLLKVKLGDKLVVMCQAADGSLGSELYSLTGVIKTGSDVVDRSMVLMHIENARQVLVLDDRATEIALLLDSAAQADAVKARLESAVDMATLEVHTWDEINPDILAFIEIDNASFFIILLIVFTVVALGIMNTMLMSIFERVREFGIMMALGTRPVQVVHLVVMEAVVLSFIAILFGATVGSLVTWHYSQTGIDLRNFVDSVQMLGVAMEPVMRTKLTVPIVLQAIGVVFALTVAVSLYPAIKAARLKPIEAIRYV